MPLLASRAIYRSIGLNHACSCPPLLGIKEEAAQDMRRPVAEDMHWMVAERNDPEEEAAADKLVCRSAQHPGPDSPSHTYIADKHCHIAAGLPIRLLRTDQFLLQFP